MKDKIKRVLPILTSISALICNVVKIVTLIRCDRRAEECHKKDMEARK